MTTKFYVLLADEVPDDGDDALIPTAIGISSSKKDLEHFWEFEMVKGAKRTHRHYSTNFYNINSHNGKDYNWYSKRILETDVI